MIVQAPDNKIIDFGDLPPDQVTSAMQNLYPSQPNQQTSQSPAQGTTSPPNVSPANSNNLNSNQNELPQQLMNWGNSLTNVNLSDLPQSGQGLSLLQKLGYGANALGRGALGTSEDLIAKPLARGFGELMARAQGEAPPNTDTSPSGEAFSKLSPDALSALAIISPTSQGRALAPAAPIPDQSPIGNRAVSAVINAPAQVVAKTSDAGNAFVKGIGATDAEDLPAVADELKSSAGKIYDQMRNVGAVFNKDASQNLVSNIDDAVESKQFIPQLNPKTVAIIDHMRDAADNGTLGLDQIDQYRRLLGRVGSTEDGVSAGLAKRAIDSFVNDADQTDLEGGNLKAVDLLNQGRAAYSQASKFEDISDILSKANGDPNRIKAGLQRFMANSDNTIGWSIPELGALKEAANNGVGENLLKAFGKFGFDFSKSGVGNTVLPALSVGAGATGAAGFGIPLAVGGTIARQGQKYLARGYAQKLLDTIGGQQ